jgi:hypothetical protein
MSRATADNMAMDEVMSKVVDRYGIHNSLTYEDVESDSVTSRFGDGLSHVSSHAGTQDLYLSKHQFLLIVMAYSS